MKRFFLFSIFLVIFCQSFGQADTLSITIKQLIEAIQKIPELDSKRQDGINELKQTFATTGETDLQKLFQVYESL